MSTKFLSFCALVISSCSFNAYSLTAEECEKEWELIAAQYERDYEKMYFSLEDLEESCIGTGIYELRKSNLLDKLGRKEESNSEFSKALKIKNEYSHMICLSALHKNYMKTLITGESTIEIENKTWILAQKNKDWYAPYELLSSMLLDREEPVKAAKLANHTLMLNRTSWMAIRNLVIAYNRMHEYEKSRKLVTTAVKLNENLLSDIDFMYSAANSYLALGNIDTAEQLLIVLVQKVPDVKGDPEFHKIVDKWKMKKSNNLDKT